MGFAPEQAGPHAPAPPSAPELRIGSVRRTTTIETVRPPSTGSRTVVRAKALEERRRADGPVERVGAQALSAALSFPGEQIEEIEAEPEVAPVDRLVGQRVGPGFRQLTREILGDRLAVNSLLHHLLDDWAGANLVSGYAMQRRADREGTPLRTSAEHLAGSIDICAGWTEDGSILSTVRRTNVVPTALGPRIPLAVAAVDAIPALGAAPKGRTEQPPVGGTRRRRRLDLWQDGGEYRFEEHFRDSYVEGRDAESVLHEYLVRGTADLRRLVVASIEAEALVLPWRECPRALASAQRIVGWPVADLRARVRDELVGTSTCTHLNDTLRVLADLSVLAAVLPG